MASDTAVIEVRQEHNLTGLKRDEVDGYFADLDARILNLDSSWADHMVKYGNPTKYWPRDVTDKDRCPWGYSWFIEGEDGTLRLWQAHWDSSG